MMSEYQWIGINGSESRNPENNYFQTNKQLLEVTGQVAPGAQDVKITAYYSVIKANNEVVEQSYSLPVRNTDIKEDGSFSAYIQALGANKGEIRIELEAADASGNSIITKMSGQINGNNQALEILSDGEAIQPNDKGAWHSYSKDIEIRGKVEPGSGAAYLKIDHKERISLRDLIDENGNFTYKLDGIKAGNHSVWLESMDADKNIATTIYDFSVGRRPGGVVLIDEDENVWTAKGKEISGKLFQEMFHESFDQPPYLNSVRINDQHVPLDRAHEIEGVGTLTINTNGSYTFAPQEGFTGLVPDIVYNSTNKIRSHSPLAAGPDFDRSILSIRVNDTEDSPYTYQLKTGDNSRGESADLHGNMGKDVLIGDNQNSAEIEINGEKIIYTVQATDDTLSGNNGNDILFGDNISTARLGFTAEDGGNAFQALKTYVEKELGSSSDGAVRYFIEENWEKLIDSSRNGGNDFLRGEAGNDILIGGSGDDKLHGGQGKDSYVFVTNSDSGQDTIINFNFEQDKLVFTELLDPEKHALEWDQHNQILHFTGTQDGYAYQNSIKFEGIKSDIELDDILKIQEVLG
ncbi:calcium-binding protein [Neisseria wadsworthii]|uniref:Uncharacterized protein n=1 Tax=Neisseria wadsworthii 9715 TaxID=1030841 RepID=G4CM07_9NEIS|nr:calcium-binding protein [Neisseria wadsworthii]EGZ51254.1 hypothetical protein HMPREF9370_0116 [Neisseria wadsworthii 9715]QMT36180.1 calcium-binding protein [Neisseria wadsworthii]